MKHFRQFLALALALMISGCVCAKPQRQFTQFGFTDSVLARYKEIAVEAVSSPATWERFHAERIGSKPLNLNRSNAEYRFDLNEPGLVRLYIDTGEKFGMHSCYVAVAIRRDNDKVVGIEESFWP